MFACFSHDLPPKLRATLAAGFGDRTVDSLPVQRAAIAAVVVAAAGCGGGGAVSHSARFDEVRPCLRRLALVGSHDPHTLTLPTQQVTTISSASTGVTVPEWVADLAYSNREARAGAGSAMLRFYRSETDARAAEGGGATVLGRGVLVWWSRPPTRRQQRQLQACLSS
jgi:hypothetical protein